MSFFPKSKHDHEWTSDSTYIDETRAVGKLTISAIQLHQSRHRTLSLRSIRGHRLVLEKRHKERALPSVLAILDMQKLAIDPKLAMPLQMERARRVLRGGVGIIRGVLVLLIRHQKNILSMCTRKQDQFINCL